MMNWAQMSTARRVILVAAGLLVTAETVLLVLGKSLPILIFVLIGLGGANYFLWRRDEAHSAGVEAEQNDGR